MNANAWLEIGHGLQLGVEDGAWAVRSKNGVFPLSSEQDFFRAVSLLEMPYGDAVNSVEYFRKVNEIILTFPFASVAKIGLTCASDYWAGFALSWLQEFSAEQKAIYSEVLSSLCDAKWASQKNRQRAERQLRSLKTQS